MTVGGIIAGEPLDIHEVGKHGDRHERVRELLAMVGLSSRARNALPARVQRRSAPTHRRGTGPRPAPRPDRRRRADQRARRLHPAPDHEPPRATAGRVRARPTCSSPTISRSSATSATVSAVMYLGRWSRPLRRRPVPAVRSTRTRWRCCRQCRSRTRGGTHAAGSSSRRRPSAAQPADGLPLPHPLLAAREAREPGALRHRGSGVAPPRHAP